MPETREPRSVLDAAEQAAAAGDYESAEQLLREAALRQEASLGPLHADLANTLNNLGVVCEITNKPDDAEHYFRRASAIAATVLEADHPFVATSRKNLEDFCKARGKTIDPPTPAPAVVADENEAAMRPADLPSEPSSEKSPPAPSRNSSRPLTIGGLIVGGLFVAFIGITWFRSNDSVSPPGRSAATDGTRPDDPAHTDLAQETIDRRPIVGVGPKTSDTAMSRQVGQVSSIPVATARSRAAESVPQLMPTAHLCRDLSTGGPRGSSNDWQCVAPSLPVGPGPLFFYTRLKSATDTTVEHRWYRGDRLHQVVELPIRANTISGFRTYSRTTLNDQDTAEWRVELRTSEGVLLHEERFVVR